MTKIVRRSANLFLALPFPVCLWRMEEPITERSPATRASSLPESVAYVLTFYQKAVKESSDFSAELGDLFLAASSPQVRGFSSLFGRRNPRGVP